MLRQASLSGPLCIHLDVSLCDKLLEEASLDQKIGIFRILEKLLNFAFQNTELFSHQTTMYQRTFPSWCEMGHPNFLFLFIFGTITQMHHIERILTSWSHQTIFDVQTSIVIDHPDVFTFIAQQDDKELLQSGKLSLLQKAIKKEEWDFLGLSTRCFFCEGHIWSSVWIFSQNFSFKSSPYSWKHFASKRTLPALQWQKKKKKKGGGRIYGYQISFRPTSE